MADNLTPEEIQRLAAAQAQYNRELDRSTDSALTLYERMRGITSELKGQETPLSRARQGFRSITADAEKILSHEEGRVKLSAKELKSLSTKLTQHKDLLDRARREFEVSDSITAQLEEQVDRAREIGIAQEGMADFLSEYLDSQTELTEEQKALLLSKYDQNDVEDSLIQKVNAQLAAQIEQERVLERQVKHFAAINDLVSKIPGLNKLAPAFRDAERAAVEAFEKTGSQVEANKAGLKALGDGLKASLQSPIGQLALLGSLFKGILNIGFAVDKQVTEIGKSQGLAATEARAFRANLYQTSRDSNDLLVTTKNLLEAQNQLAAASGATSGFTQQELKTQTALTQRVGLQAESAAKLANLARVSNTTGEDALDSVIAQTTQLKLQSGINLENKGVLEEVASINGQLAATLGNNPTKIAAAVVQVRKLGLNLEQARSIAKGLLDFETSIGAELEAELLTGKELNLDRARSLALQGDFAGATAEVARQVGSLADFQNMNVIAQESLAKAAGMTVDELANSLMQQENLSKLGAQTKQDVLDRVKALKAEGKVQEANNLLNQAANEKDAKAALLRLDAQQQFTAAVEKAKDFFTGIANNLPLLVGSLTVIAGLMTAIAVSSLMTALGLTGGLAAAGILAGMAALGLTAGLVTSNLSTPDPGKADMGGNPDNQTIKANDFTIQTHPKDTLVMAGGTKLNDGAEKTNRLLERLISAVEKGGNVYLDGQKVGEALVLSNTTL